MIFWNSSPDDRISRRKTAGKNNFQDRFLLSCLGPFWDCFAARPAITCREKILVEWWAEMERGIWIHSVGAVNGSPAHSRSVWSVQLPCQTDQTDSAIPAYWPDILCHTCIPTRHSLTKLHTDHTHSAIPAYWPDRLCHTCIQTRQTLPCRHTDQTYSAIPTYKPDRLSHTCKQTRHNLSYLHTDQTYSAIPSDRPYISVAETELEPESKLSF